MTTGIQTVYLETSAFNAPFADDAPEQKNHAEQVLDGIRQGLYKPITSDYVIRELKATPDSDREKREAMLNLVDKYGISVYPIGAEAERLADIYIREGVLTERRRVDAMHIALATVNGADVIVSYNFRHIIKRRVVAMTRVINEREGYKGVEFLSHKGVNENDG